MFGRYQGKRSVKVEYVPGIPFLPLNGAAADGASPV